MGQPGREPRRAATTRHLGVHRPVLLRPQRTPGITLAEALDEGAPADLSAQPVLRGITADSRLVAPGDLYVALPGQHRHGALFAAEAIAAGAVAVLTDPAGGALVRPRGAPVVVVSDPRTVMAGAAARIYGHPSERVTMFGITGTNGKTTTTCLLESALRAAGLSAGVIGTLGFTLDGQPLDAPRTTVTTPEAPELQAIVAVMAERGADAVVMEVSSHALVLGRADAIIFDVAGFTNLGQDHLDFHHDLESYFGAKAQLFTSARARRAVISLDDPRGPALVDQARREGLPVVTVSLSTTSDADFRVVHTSATTDGSTGAEIVTPAGPVDLVVALPGDFNLRNAVTALAMADQAGVDLARAASGLARAQVPGRMQRVRLGESAPVVFVDFAHTPQAVSAALGTLAGFSRRIVVLGCGGDRDPDKRRPMGAAAAAAADVVVVTDDNPRTENAAAIRAEVLAGARAQILQSGADVTVVDGGDRRSAVREALRRAAPADVVAVLGKGHERGQEVAGQMLPFDDVMVVAEEWRRLQATASGGAP